MEPSAKAWRSLEVYSQESTGFLKFPEISPMSRFRSGSPSQSLMINGWKYENRPDLPCPKNGTIVIHKTSSIKDPPTLGVSVARFHRKAAERESTIGPGGVGSKAYSQHFRAEGCHVPKQRSNINGVFGETPWFSLRLLSTG